MVKHIPNIITSLNLLCGGIAILLAASGDLVTAAFFVFAGIFFDFFDGLAARLLNARSEVGLQLDSLADVITSGLAPAVVMVQLLSLAVFGTYTDFAEPFSPDAWNSDLSDYLPFTGLIIAVAAAYRLAKFNVDTRQSDSFIGLPTPANAILILSLPLILHFQPTETLDALILNKWFLLGLTVFSCIIMNAELPLFALKFKSWDFRSNVVRYIFLLLSLLLLIFLKFAALPVIIVVYILISLFRRN